MNLLEVIALGAYGYTTLVGGFLWRQLTLLRDNHVEGLTSRIIVLEDRLGINRDERDDE